MYTLEKRRTNWRSIAVIGMMLSASTTRAADHNPMISSERLTLDAMISAVLAENPRLAAIRAAADAATSRIEPAGALDDPTVSYTLAPATIPEFETGAGRSRAPNQGITVSQSLPWPGKRTLRQEAARLDAEAVTGDVAGSRLDLIAATKTGYSEWFYVHRALAVNAANLTMLEELRAAAESRYAAGLVGQQDVLQAEVREAELQRQRLRLHQSREQIAAEINALLHRTPGTPVPLPTALPPIVELPDIQQIQANAVSRHPQLEQLMQEIAANDVRVELAEKEFFPDFKVSAGYNSLWDAPDKRWTIGIGINLPFSQEKRRARKDEAVAISRQLQFQLDDRRDQVLRSIRQAYAAAHAAADTVHLYRETLLPRSHENLNAARAEYGAGAGAFLDVISAEIQLHDAELGLARAHADHVIARAELERWGGGEQQQPSTAYSQP